MSKIVSLTVTILFLSVGVLLGILNPNTVPFDIFFYQLQSPLSLLLAIFLIIGMLIGGLFMSAQVFRLRWAIKKLEKENQKRAHEVLEMKKDSLQQQKLQALSLEKNNT